MGVVFMLDSKYIQRVAHEAGISDTNAVKAIQLFDEGSTIPFIARYRKDVTGGLNEVQLEIVADRMAYYAALAARKLTVLENIEKDGKLTQELRESIENCFDKRLLEDIYLPYRKQRRTKATMAREKGLEPLADFIWAQLSTGKPFDEVISEFVRADRSVSSPEEALEGARFILAERIALDLGIRHMLRERFLMAGTVTAHPTKNAEGLKTKYETYYAFQEPVAKIPSHRFLAIVRGVKEGLLRMELALDDATATHDILAYILHQPGTLFEPLLREAVEDSYFRLLRPSIESEVKAIVQERSDDEAIRVFRENAENLLLSAPAGALKVIGLDPGMRTGCKLAIVDANGSFVESAVVFPTPPQNDVEGAETTLLALIEKHNIQAIAIGNGTAGREAARFVKSTLAKKPSNTIFVAFVNEAGASIYSTSKIAREEFPDLDPTVRGAVSIARRLQDPLAELVRIEPRHIGVGQYQHDVNQKSLREGLHRTVVSCVNRVGVDLNTASAPLLRYVSGINITTARTIVEHRAKEGLYKSRQQLLFVEGMGPKVFEQCAGFLRLPTGDNPLEATGIHPEAYPVVEQIALDLGLSIADLLANPTVLKDFDLSKYQNEVMGPRALADIRDELLKPRRDPRKEFKIPRFIDGVDSIQLLEVGMECEGVVTNVTDFGAFVDIGVHQDGLVHLSELANRFVQDPRDVVKVGDIVRIKVIKVDKELPRISLSMRQLLPPAETRPPRRRRRSENENAEAPQPVESGSRQAAERIQTADVRMPIPPAESPRVPKKPRHKPQGQKKVPVAVRGDGGHLSNSQLADQLAALRSKLGG
ncbi:MAG: RNA-binding protein [Candidatus Hydrogenedentota bacterium]